MKQINFLLSAIFLLCTSSALQAAVVVADHNITSIDDFLKGSQLRGMNISVTFSDDSTSSDFWNGSDITRTDWKLSYNGTNTLSGIWKFTNSSSMLVKSVVFDLIKSNAVFDKTHFNQGPSTTGSKSGGFSIAGGLAPLQFEHSFTGTVGLNGAAPIGDLFVKLLINDFGKQPDGSLNNASSFSFIADTDLAVVPVPAAVYLFGSALLGLFGVKRRNTQV